MAGVGAEAKAGIPGRFELQLGYTFQRSRYDEPEKWSDDVTPQRRMFRSPDHYGYLTANVNLTRDFTASVFGNYTGRMLVQHNAGYIERDTERLTPDFWDMGLRLSYNFRLTKQLRLELNAGVKTFSTASRRTSISARTKMPLISTVRQFRALTLSEQNSRCDQDVPCYSDAGPVPASEFVFRA